MKGMGVTCQVTWVSFEISSFEGVALLMLRVRIGSDSLMESFLLPLWLSMENLKMKVGL